MSTSYVDICKKITDSLDLGKVLNLKIYRETMSAIEGLVIDMDEESISRFINERVAHHKEMHTYSINDCPRVLSSVMKRIAIQRSMIPSELVVDILKEWVSINEPKAYERMVKLKEVS